MFSHSQICHAKRKKNGLQKEDIHCYLEFTDNTRVKRKHKFVLATVCNIKTDKIQLSIGEFEAIDHLFQFANMGVKQLKTSVGLTKIAKTVDCKELKKFQPQKPKWPRISSSYVTPELEKKVKLCLIIQ